MFKRLLAFAVLVCAAELSAGGFSQTQDFRPATADELAMKGVASTPDVPAAILDWVRLDDDPDSISSEYYRVKVFTEEGKKYGDVEIAYFAGYPVSGRISDISARTIRPDGTIVPFDGKVYDKVLVKGGGLTFRAKTFSLADVQPGSILEYRFIRRWSRNMLLNTHWATQRDIPILRAKLTLKPYNAPDSEFASYFIYQGQTTKRPEKQPNGIYLLDLENVPPLVREELAPPEEQLTAKVTHFYTSSRVKATEFWNVQPAVWNKEIESFIKANGALARQIAGATQDRAALEKLYAHVQSLRNLSFEAEKSEQEIDRERIRDAKHSDEVLKKGAGFRNELTRVFVGLARGAGFDATVVRVAPRDERFFSKNLPDPDQMPSEVAMVMLDGQALYLDPGTPLAPFGIVSWEKTGVAGIAMSKKDGPRWVETPSGKPEEALVRRAADLRLNDDTLEGTVAVTFSGQEALVRRVRTISDDETAKRKALEDEAKSWFPDGATVTLKEVNGDRAADPTLGVVFDVSLPNAVSRAGSRVVVPVSIFTSKAKNPFAPTTRTHPVYLPYAFTEEDHVKLALPDGYSAVLPAPKKIAVGTASYNSEAKQEGNAVTFKRLKSVDLLLVEAKYYNALRNFYSAVVDADQKQLVLQKNAP